MARWRTCRVSVARSSSTDARKVLLAQALRALAYGFGSVHLGLMLEARDWSTVRIACSSPPPWPAWP